MAHARLSDARRLATGEAPRDFYAEVARALRGFVADKLNIAEAGMQVGDAREGMGREGVSGSVIQEVLDCLDHCDLQRFAPPKEDAGEVLIVVTDDGPGIADEHLPRLFERFYRVDKARSRKMGGTGLGLAVVSKIISQHGGRVVIRSRETEGTLVRILLPAQLPT